MSFPPLDFVCSIQGAISLIALSSSSMSLVITDSNNNIHILEFLVGERFKVLGGISFARVVVHVAVLERELFSDFLTVKGPVKSYFVTNVKN